MGNINEPWEELMDPLVGTLSTAKWYFPMDNHRKCIGGYVDSAIVKEAITSLLLVFETKLLYDNSYISVGHTIFDDTRVYIASLESVENKWRQNTRI